MSKWANCEIFEGEKDFKKKIVKKSKVALLYGKNYGYCWAFLEGWDLPKLPLSIAWKYKQEYGLWGTIQKRAL